jgi:hypothetical protein
MMWSKTMYNFVPRASTVSYLPSAAVDVWGFQFNWAREIKRDSIARGRLSNSIVSGFRVSSPSFSSSEPGSVRSVTLFTVRHLLSMKLNFAGINETRMTRRCL